MCRSSCHRAELSNEDAGRSDSTSDCHSFIARADPTDLVVTPRGKTRHTHSPPYLRALSTPIRRTLATAVRTRHYRVGFGLDAASSSFWCLVQYAAHGTASSRFESIGPPSTRHCP